MCRFIGTLCFVGVMVVAGLTVFPSALPDAVDATRQQPVALLLVAGCWAAATVASVAGKRLIAVGHLGWLDTTTCHVSGTVANRVVPAGVGSAGVFIAALRRGGASTCLASSIVALWAAAGGVIHASGLAFGLGWLRYGTAGLVVVAAVAASLALLTPTMLRRARSTAVLERLRRRRRRSAQRRPRTAVQRAVRRRALDVADTARQLASSVRARPAIAIGALLAQLASMLCLAIGFATAVTAFAVPVTVGTAMAIYMAGTAVSATTPTPAGIGSSEAALVAGLVVAGVSFSEAFPVVLLFRAVILLAPIVAAAAFAGGWAAGNIRGWLGNIRPSGQPR
ncbi:lysylphosphatidylglycerol synthase transmembrane domain-containing protein [Phytoactinopolyspora halotolerans]|uniref:Flippase-like domain-containing protein n=1 Tax=Phytoactinopolyspora halotolerans TaxID=1981512 RepID=A0A6L9SBZ1_9ACTN|nr:lysylphosphatidylglycerol synthase domain-containing protein [Phytoactinopolyspora halotolerans]NEE01530.1 hypothetical protein [Phytoactinopolyspora halotolerans]